jgi:hypothetical protein
LAGKHVEVLPAVHTVPAAGYAVATGKGCWVFTGDTEQNPALWARINQMNVAMLVIETAFSNRERTSPNAACIFRPMHSPMNWIALSEEKITHLHHPYQARRDRPHHGRNTAL